MAFILYCKSQFHFFYIFLYIFSIVLVSQLLAVFLRKLLPFRNVHKIPIFPYLLLYFQKRRTLHYTLLIFYLLLPCYFNVTSSCIPDSISQHTTPLFNQYLEECFLEKHKRVEHCNFSCMWEPFQFAPQFAVCSAEISVSKKNVLFH